MSFKRRTFLIMTIWTSAILWAGVGSADTSNAPLDTEIRVLGIHNGSQDAGFMAGELADIVLSWNATPHSPGIPVTVTLANGGQALTVPELIGSGTGEVQYLDALVKSQTIPTVIQSIRDLHRADIIVYFGDAAEDCGASLQDYWTGWPNSSFEGDVLGLDLRGSEIFFVAAVYNDPSGCPNKVAAHEFNHLLGGGHNSGDIGFYSDSLAHLKGTQSINHEEQEITIDVVASVGASFAADLLNMCNIVAGLGDPIELGDCSRKRKYSSTSFGDSNHQNARAHDKTSLSVANYRTGEPGTGLQCNDGVDNDGDGNVDLGDGDCSGLTDVAEFPPPSPPPQNCQGNEFIESMNMELDDICGISPLGWLGTSYNIQWEHACPQNVSSYEVWYSQPDGDPEVFLVRRVTKDVGVWVRTFPARIKVKTCPLVGPCSGFSNSTVLPIPMC